MASHSRGWLCGWLEGDREPQLLNPALHSMHQDGFAVLVHDRWARFAIRFVVQESVLDIMVVVSAEMQMDSVPK